jgi:hypothetical protein
MIKMANSNNPVNRLVSQLAAEKKKSITALCLIAVMAFMWLRVLSGRIPETAGAAPMHEEMTEGQSNSESKISFIELPKVKGRNDVLARDFFAVDGGSLSGTGEVNVVSKNGDEEYVNRIAEKLKLAAIELGENPQVFINDKLLSVGDKLIVRDGVNTYECEVIGIEKNMVFMRCGEAEITLKLMQTIDTAD